MNASGVAPGDAKRETPEGIVDGTPGESACGILGDTAEVGDIIEGTPGVDPENC